MSENAANAGAEATASASAPRVPAPPSDAPALAPWGISLNDVVVTYPNGVRGLDGVSLEIEPGEMVAVVGLSGSGKSSLIRTINGLVPVTSGRLEVGGHRVDGIRPANCACFAARSG